MDLEAETRANSKDIHALTVTVTRVVTMQENAEKRRDADVEMVKSAVGGIEDIKQNMNRMFTMEKDIKSLNESLAGIMGDTRANRHDVQNALNALNGMPVLNERISKCAADISSLQATANRMPMIEERTSENGKQVASIVAEIDNMKAWRNQRNGATGMAKYILNVVWAVLGGSIVALTELIIKKNS